MPPVFTAKDIMPTLDEVTHIVTAKLSYDKAKSEMSPADFRAWVEDKSRHFVCNPRGIAWCVGPRGHENMVRYSSRKKLKTPSENDTLCLALRFFIVALTIGWDDLAKELKQSLRFWKITATAMQQYATDVWLAPGNPEAIAKMIDQVQATGKIKLVEAVEKHNSLNPKLFTRDEVLKERVKDKMLEIVDEFLSNLKEQDIKIKVKDILLIGSNASYNYTKDSDIDLHIVADSKATKYEPEIAAALYGAYRTLFNKQLNIELYDIPVEIFVETEDSPRVSNGVYSVKKDNWVKKPVQEDIPEYDTKALDELVAKWEAKCKEILEQAENGKLKDETKLVKLLEDIYEKLRKKGVAKSEYSIENLAFKELRNKGYLDKLKDGRNDLISKRLSLEETLSRQNRVEIIRQLTHAAGTQPIVQDNGMFFIYNLKASEISRVVSNLRQLPFVTEVHSHENGKYDFSNVLDMAMNKMPSKYYDIRGFVDEAAIL